MKKLGEYDIYLVASPEFVHKYKIEQVADLSHVPWVNHSLLNWQDTQYFLQDAQGKKQSFPLIKSQYESNSAAVIHQMVLASLGMAICPAWLVDEDIKEKRLVRVLPEYRLPKQNIQLLYPNTFTLPAKTRTFIDYLVSHLNLK